MPCSPARFVPRLALLSLALVFLHFDPLAQSTSQSSAGSQGTGPPIQTVRADFTATPTSADGLLAPVSVQFLDLSSGTVTSWSWDFGDGSTSTLPSPSHDYLDIGYYTVSLLVSGPAGTSRRSRLNYVDLYGPLGWVHAEQKISDTQGGFEGVLANTDEFGSSVTPIGDWNGDGIEDLAVGARGSNFARGAFWILFMNRDGTVRSETKIGNQTPGLFGELPTNGNFGRSIAYLGDHDGDGVGDFLVGARQAVWTIFLNADLTVKSHRRIAQGEGGFGGTLDTDDEFGIAVAALGDVDGAGASPGAVAVGAPRTEHDNRGAVWILFLESNGTVMSEVRIAHDEGGFGPHLFEQYNFGYSLAPLGDLDGDGTPDVAVGTPLDNDVEFWRGSVWILFLNASGQARGQVRIGSETAGMPELQSLARFGVYMGPLGDFDGDGLQDLVVQQYYRAAQRVWLLLLNADGTVKGYETLDDLDPKGFSNSFEFLLNPVGVSDLNGDGSRDLALCNPSAGDGGPFRGALWLLSLDDGM